MKIRAKGVIAGVNDIGNKFIGVPLAPVSSSLPLSLTTVNDLRWQITSRIFTKTSKRPHGIIRDKLIREEKLK
jgi:hypothetical protein